MRNSLAKSVGVMTVLLAAGVLAACGNVSHKVTRDGSGAEQLVWPKVESTVPTHKGGTYPGLDALGRVHAGMNKQQIASLIGTPHFQEGVFGVREWNYLFNLRQPGSGEVTVCQYKILFDEQKLARSFHWMPASCADLLKSQVDEKEPQQTFTLSSDALFGFDKSAVDDILPDGRAQLDALAADILKDVEHVGNIRVLGYTDRLGSDTYNNALSAKRAYAVMHYLVKMGVPEPVIEVVGLGEAEPVKTDCADQSRQALIACLAPNRRVEVRMSDNK